MPLEIVIHVVLEILGSNPASSQQTEHLGLLDICQNLVKNEWPVDSFPSKLCRQV